MIELKEISKVYKHRETAPALNSINLTIEKGEQVALIGPSGSGKTTLLNIIGGIARPTNGEYYFNEQLLKYTENNMAKFRAQNIGYILQNHYLINNRSVFYNIALPLKQKSVDKKRISEEVTKVSIALDIYDKLKMYPNELSGGEAQRVCIARAIILNPNVILADEPTSALDHENKKQVLKLLKDLNVSGKTIIIATHDSSAMHACNRIVEMHSGKIIT